MSQETLLELPEAEPVYPERIRAMWRIHGKAQGCRCGRCAHLVRVRYANSYLKCGLSVMTSSAATDWRASWPACGAFMAGKGEVMDAVH
jgi:hypothetical protein